MNMHIIRQPQCCDFPLERCATVHGLSVHPLASTRGVGLACAHHLRRQLLVDGGSHLAALASDCLPDPVDHLCSKTAQQNLLHQKGIEVQAGGMKSVTQESAGLTLLGRGTPVEEPSMSQ